MNIVGMLEDLSGRAIRKCVDWCGGGDLNPYALRR